MRESKRLSRSHPSSKRQPKQHHDEATIISSGSSSRPESSTSEHQFLQNATFPKLRGLLSSKPKGVLLPNPKRPLSSIRTFGDPIKSAYDKAPGVLPTETFSSVSNFHNTQADTTSLISLQSTAQSYPSFVFADTNNASTQQHATEEKPMETNSCTPCSSEEKILISRANIFLQKNAAFWQEAEPFLREKYFPHWLGLVSEGYYEKYLKILKLSPYERVMYRSMIDTSERLGTYGSIQQSVKKRVKIYDKTIKDKLEKLGLMPQNFPEDNSAVILGMKEFYQKGIFDTAGNPLFLLVYSPPVKEETVVAIEKWLKSNCRTVATKKLLLSLIINKLIQRNFLGKSFDKRNESFEKSSMISNVIQDINRIADRCLITEIRMSFKNDGLFGGPYCYRWICSFNGTLTDVQLNRLFLAAGIEDRMSLLSKDTGSGCHCFSEIQIDNCTLYHLSELSKGGPNLTLVKTMIGYDRIKYPTYIPTVPYYPYLCNSNNNPNNSCLSDASLLSGTTTEHPQTTQYLNHYLIVVLQLPQEGLNGFLEILNNSNISPRIRKIYKTFFSADKELLHPMITTRSDIPRNSYKLISNAKTILCQKKLMQPEFPYVGHKRVDSMLQFYEKCIYPSGNPKFLVFPKIPIDDTMLQQLRKWFAGKNLQESVKKMFLFLFHNRYATREYLLKTFYGDSETKFPESVMTKDIQSINKIGGNITLIENKCMEFRKRCGNDSCFNAPWYIFVGKLVEDQFQGLCSAASIIPDFLVVNDSSEDEAHYFSDKEVDDSILVEVTDMQDRDRGSPCIRVEESELKGKIENRRDSSNQDSSFVRDASSSSPRSQSTTKAWRKRPSRMDRNQPKAKKKPVGATPFRGKSDSSSNSFSYGVSSQQEESNPSADVFSENSCCPGSYVQTSHSTPQLDSNHETTVLSDLDLTNSLFAHTQTEGIDSVALSDPFLNFLIKDVFLDNSVPFNKDDKSLDLHTILDAL